MSIQVKCKLTVEGLTAAIAFLKLQEPSFSCTLDGVIEITKISDDKGCQELDSSASEPTDTTLDFFMALGNKQREQEAAAERGEYPDKE